MVNISAQFEYNITIHDSSTEKYEKGIHLKELTFSVGLNYKPSIHKVQKQFNKAKHPEKFECF